MAYHANDLRTEVIMIFLITNKQKSITTEPAVFSERDTSNRQFDIFGIPGFKALLGCHLSSFVLDNVVLALSGSLGHPKNLLPTEKLAL